MNNLINLKELSKFLGYRTNRVLATIKTKRKLEFGVRIKRVIHLPLQVLCDSIKNDLCTTQLREWYILEIALRAYQDSKSKGFGININVTIDDLKRRIEYARKHFENSVKLANKMNKTRVPKVTVLSEARIEVLPRHSYESYVDYNRANPFELVNALCV